MLAIGPVLSLSTLLLHTLGSRALPSPEQQIVFSPDIVDGKTPRALVIWHGLGDTAHADGISEFIEDIKAVHPGIYVHSVQIPEGGSVDDERKAGFFGNMTAQAEEGCEQLAAVPELRSGFDAMGFSQGGLYLRYYAQYCNSPPIRNLITFGTPHFGISALIPCPTPPTLSCILAARAARLGIYTAYAQRNLVQAQYYRDVERLDEYLEINEFLRDLNGELQSQPPSTSDLERRETLGWRERGGDGLSGLENFVAVMFDADRTVSPAQSAHFGAYALGNKTVVVPVHQQELYTNDWIGLKGLDERGGLNLVHCPGEHMDLGTGDCGMRMVQDWVGWQG